MKTTRDLSGRGRRLRNRDSRAGGVSMEYVILAVLIAAAVVVAVAVFSRSLYSSFVAASQGASLQEKTAHSEFVMRKADRQKDAKVAAEYHDSMHE